jgi:DNA-binding GntR family transcriptional regulator
MNLLQMDQTKSKPVSLRQRVYEQIKRDIITLKLAPGTPLSEFTIAETYNISKTPVREALTSLQQDKLVEYQTNRGFMVTSITIQDIHEIYEARVFYECILLELAVERITDEEIDKLQSYSEIGYDWDDPSTIDVYIQANDDFHMGIAYGSRNSRLILHYQHLMDEAQRLIYMDLKSTNVLEIWHESHKRFTDALRARDAQAGIAAVKEVMANGKRRILGV